MSATRAFFLGLGGQHVDYATRHHSRAYDIGWNVSCAAYVSTPFLVCFGVGVAVGAWIW